ncbi:hypothetical protein ACFU7Y_33060 [Kitasatospora sp. NPDC057542]|uniref:hypothetical protein n=1 Tax=Streptomycetaceae TaxID=2062 RepID=UPI001CCE86E1|nr:hypothetical protein [Streptomyces sp. LS1784]
MRVHEDLVLRARVRLLSHNGRILHGEEGLWVYRALFTVSPAAYAYKLAFVLREAAEGPRVAHLPEARRALLAQAQAACAHIPAHAPAHQVRMWEYPMTELRRIEQQLGSAGQ